MKNKKDFIFCHRGLGTLDYYLPKAFECPEDIETHFFIYSIWDWYSLNASVVLACVIKDSNSKIHFHLGSLRSKNAKITDKLLLSTIRKLIRALYRMGFSKMSLPLRLINFLIVGNGRKRTIPSFSSKAFKESTLWAQWSKFDCIGQSILLGLTKLKEPLRLLPDAPYTESFYTMQNLDLLEQLDVRFYMGSQSNGDIFSTAYPQYKDKIEIASLPSAINSWHEKFHSIKKSKTADCEISLLFLAQKNNGPGFDKEQFPEYSSLSNHRRNMTSVFKVLSNPSFNSKVSICYKAHPKLAPDEKWLLNKGKEFGVNISIIKSGSLWPLIFQADIVVSEFTSAFIHASVVPCQLLVNGQSLEHYCKISPIIKSTFQPFFESGAVIQPEEIEDRLKKLLLKIYPPPHQFKHDFSQ